MGRGILLPRPLHIMWGRGGPGTPHSTLFSTFGASILALVPPRSKLVPIYFLYAGYGPGNDAERRERESERRR